MIFNIRKYIYFMSIMFTSFVEVIALMDLLLHLFSFQLTYKQNIYNKLTPLHIHMGNCYGSISMSYFDLLFHDLQHHDVFHEV